jgi:hypothetical protein
MTIHPEPVTIFLDTSVTDVPTVLRTPIWWFLDDEREPVDRPDRHWVIFRTGESLVEMLRQSTPDGLPDGISFDHDLGDGRMTGHDVAKVILNMVLDGILRVFDDFQFVVHSQNPIGAKNIWDTMNDIYRIEPPH